MNYFNPTYLVVVLLQRYTLPLLNTSMSSCDLKKNKTSTLRGRISMCTLKTLGHWVTPVGLTCLSL